MQKQTENIQELQKKTMQRIEQEPSNAGTATIVDNRPSMIIQRKLKSVMDTTDTDMQLIQQKKPMGSPIFQQIATTMGKEYGVNTSNLKATHNSSFPAQLGAAATIQGNNIHFAPNMDTVHNIKHEVAHAIDNKLHGTPKGDKEINGQKIDTTREKVVESMVKDTRQVKVNTSNSVKEEVSDSPVQRLPLNTLNIVIKKLRKGGFDFDDTDVTKEGNGNISRLTIQQMRYRGLDFNNVVFDARGRILTGDPLGGVSLHIGNITGDNLYTGNKFYRINAFNLNMNISLVKKIGNLGAILWRMLKNTLKKWLPLPDALRPNQTEVPYKEYGLNMLGAGSNISIERLQIDTLQGSIATRVGKGGYTGEEGRVQTQSLVEGAIEIQNLELNVDQVPNRNQQEYVTTVNIGNLTVGRNKRKLIKAGEQVRKPKTKRDQFGLQDINFTLHQNSNDFNLNEITFNNQNQNYIIIENKGPFENIVVGGLQSVIDQNGTGNITANIRMTMKTVTFVRINFQINVPIRNWEVTLDDVFQQIESGLRNYYLPFFNGSIEYLLSFIMDLKNPDVLRRTLDVFDPELPNTNEDVIRTNAPQDYERERAIAINIARLFEYHAASKIRRALGS